MIYSNKSTLRAVIPDLSHMYVTQNRRKKEFLLNCGSNMIDHAPFKFDLCLLEYGSNK